MAISITCEPWWKPAESIEELRQSDHAKRMNGRAYVAVDVSCLATLCHNLAIGAALCRAYALGEDDVLKSWRSNEQDSTWSPGCGRSAP